MLVVLPFSHRDIDAAENLIRWIGELDPRLKHHTLLLLGSYNVDRERQKRMESEAKEIFGYVASVRQSHEDPPGEHWPKCPNIMFSIATKYVARTYGCAFLWLEPDCVPLKSEWLDTLESEYKSCGKRFMGAVWDKPSPHMNGNGIYPPNFVYDGPDTVPFDVMIGQRGGLFGTKNTPLIQHEWGDIKTNTPWTWPDRESLHRLRGNAVMFHRCKDGTLVTRLRELKSQRDVESPVAPPNGVFQSIAKSIKGMLRSCSTYYHSGNLGDVVYALYSIKLDGGGELIIGPEQRQTSPCAVPINRDQFNLFKPLLDLQPYLTKVEYSPKYPERRMLDLNTFRNNWNDWRLRTEIKADTLCKMHCHTLGVLNLFREDEAWLEPVTPMSLGRIVVHRSPRYQHAQFPWRSLVNKYGKDMIFTGLESEHQAFCNQFGSISYWKPRDFLEMARLIQGARCFLGNQSFPLSIALGLGQKVICECWDPSPDCRFKRPTYIDHRNMDQYVDFLC